MYDLYILMGGGGGGGVNSTTIQCIHEQSYWNMHIPCVLFASNGSPMYKSLTKTKKKYSELETLKRVASANAISNTIEVL